MITQPTEPPTETVEEKPKAKLALYWAASCGGCEIAVLSINEKILDVAAAFDIVLWPTGQLLVQVKVQGGKGYDLWTVKDDGTMEKTYPGAAMELGLPPECDPSEFMHED